MRRSDAKRSARGPVTPMIKDKYLVHADRMAGQIIKASLSHEGFLLFVHKNVDGDCVGAACGMAQVLRNAGYKAGVAISEKLPDSMEYMGVDDLVFDPMDYADRISVSNYMPFATDCSESHRMGKCGRFFECGRKPLIIDHHASVSLKDEQFWIDGDASSASELCYYTALMLEEKTGRKLIDRRAAVCFLTGIVTDTGKFAYKNTMPETLVCAGELTELGARTSDISYNMFDRKPRNVFDLVTHFRSKVEFHADGQIALLRAYEEDFWQFGADDSAIDEMPSVMRDIEGVELSVVLRISEGRIRCNLRSKDHFDCSTFATAFGGGGHMRASGFNLPAEEHTIDEVAEAVIRKATERLR